MGDGELPKWKSGSWHEKKGKELLGRPNAEQSTAIT